MPAAVLVTVGTGLVVGALTRIVGDRLASLIKTGVKTGEARVQLLQLEETCKKIQSKISSSIMSDQWLHEVELCIYDAEDVIDNIHQARKKQESPTEQFKLSGFHVGRIKDLNFRLAEKLSEEAIKERQASTSQSQSSEPKILFGFQKEAKEKIIEELKRNGSFGVTLILGMTGIGKTALADAILKDESITSVFNCIEIRIAPITPVPDCFNEAVQKIRKLRAEEQPKKLLILFDGLQKVSPSEWAKFKRFLEEVEPGDKVLITSRNPRVADVTGSSYVHCLDQLADEDCYELVKTYAGLNKELEKPDLNALEQFRKGLVDKCYGLPLLACHLGLLLSAEKEGRHRSKKLRDMNAKNLWKLLKSEENLPDLLSGFLPFEFNIQRCLAYCSLFPPCHDFEKADMVELWIAAGFAQGGPTKNEDDLQKTVGSYFDDILSHSILQHSKLGAGGEESYTMHELFRHLAESVAPKIVCRLVEGTDLSFDFKDARHLSLSCDDDDGGGEARERDLVQGLLSELETNAKKLRTFLFLKESGRNITINPTFVKDLHYLRVLDLSYTNLTKLNGISNLKHLRFVNLSHTPVEYIGSLTKVFALRVLKLENCLKLHCLPNDISNLINLVCIQVKIEDSGAQLPSIGKLINIQMLDVFVVGDEEGYKISELGRLKHLKKSIRIKKLENVKSAFEATQAELKDKTGLRMLELEWSNSTADEARSQLTFLVLEALQPPVNLERLMITNYSGNKIPQWLGKKEICGALETIELSNCKGCTILPSLGQLGMLKTLRLVAMHKLTEFGDELHEEAFPSQLEELELSDLPSLTEWKLTTNSMPLLRDLQIRNCCGFVNLPPLDQLTSLQQLEIDGCTNLEELPTLPSSMKNEGGRLTIIDCEILQGRCQDGGPDWTKIKDIRLRDITPTLVVQNKGTRSKNSSTSTDPPASLKRDGSLLSRIVKTCTSFADQKEGTTRENHTSEVSKQLRPDKGKSIIQIAVQNGESSAQNVVDSSSVPLHGTNGLQVHHFVDTKSILCSTQPLADDQTDTSLDQVTPEDKPIAIFNPPASPKGNGSQEHQTCEMNAEIGESSSSNLLAKASAPPRESHNLQGESPNAPKTSSNGRQWSCFKGCFF